MTYVGIEVDYLSHEIDDRYIFADYDIKGFYDNNEVVSRLNLQYKTNHIKYKLYDSPSEFRVYYVQRKGSEYYTQCPKCRKWVEVKAKEHCMEYTIYTGDIEEAVKLYIPHEDTLASSPFNWRPSYTRDSGTTTYTTSNSQSPVYHFLCSECECSIPVCSCIVSDFKEWTLVPKILLSYEDHSTLTVALDLEQIKSFGDNLFIKPYYIKFSFNYSTGKTSYYRVSYDENNNQSVRRQSDVFFNTFYHDDEINGSFNFLDKVSNSQFYDEVSKKLKKYIESYLGYPVAKHPMAKSDRRGSHTTSSTGSDSEWNTYYTCTSTDSTHIEWDMNYSVRDLIRCNFRDLIFYNRYPHVPANETSLLMNYSSYECDKESGVRNLVKTLISKPRLDPVQHIINTLRLPRNKSLIKIGYQSHATLLRYPNIASYFKDINNITKLMRASIFQPIDIRDVRKVVRGEYVYKDVFLDLLFGKFSEVIVCNKLYHGLGYYRDTKEMYEKIVEKDIVINYEEIKGSIKNIHDYFTYILDLVETEDLPLRERIPRLDLEKSFDDYSITFAESTHTLKHIGRKLSMCVGTYDDKAYEGRCHILTLQQGQKYLSCIELSSDFTKVRQVKGFDNNLLEGELKTIISKWILENKLQVDTRDIKIEIENFN